MEPPGDRSRVNLRNVDLNLLVAFDVLMRERHVTRAARRLGVGQPAMSASLSRLRHLSPDATIDALERNELDLAVSTGLDVPKSIECRGILEDRIVCVLSKAHPCAAGFDDVDTFVNLPQIRVSQSPLDDRFVDHQLAASGLDRNIALTVPHWLVVPEIIARTGLAAVMPHSIAARFAAAGDLRIVPPPIEDCAFMWCLYWHRRHNADAGHQWLRRLILGVGCAGT